MASAALLLLLACDRRAGIAGNGDAGSAGPDLGTQGVEAGCDWDASGTSSDLGSTGADANCSSGASIALADLATQRLDADCDWEARCGFYPDKATCLATMHLDLAQLVADVNAGRITMDGKAAASCLSAIRLQSCGSVTDQMSGLVPPEESCLGDVFKPNLDTGGACLDESQCIGGFVAAVSPVRRRSPAAGTHVGPRPPPPSARLAVERSFARPEPPAG